MSRVSIARNAIFAHFAVMACVLALQPMRAGAQSPAGHYYLQGVMETGSELRLKPDGRFQWMISYGAVDQYAEGRWAREADHIVLRAQKPTAAAARVERRPWSREAQQALLDREAGLLESRIEDRCMFLYLDGEADAPSPAYTDADAGGRVADAELRRRDAQIRELDARHAGLLQAAASADGAALAAYGSAAQQAQMKQARAARAAFQQADQALRRAYSEYNTQRLGREHAFAERDVLDIPVLRPPAACIAPSPAEASALASTWTPTLAVHVLDMQGNGIAGLPLHLAFAKPAKRTGHTVDDGWAVFAREEWRTDSGELTSIVLGDETFGFTSETFAIEPGQGAVVEIHVDLAAYQPQAFQHMRLRIEGEDLIPDWPGHGERGRYRKQ